jgi:hypothetical protein
MATLDGVPSLKNPVKGSGIEEYKEKRVTR